MIIYFLNNAIFEDEKATHCGILAEYKRIDQSIKACEGESRLLLVSLETTSI